MSEPERRHCSLGLRAPPGLCSSRPRRPPGLFLGDSRVSGRLDPREAAAPFVSARSEPGAVCAAPSLSRSSTWGDCLYAPCTGEDTRAESLTVQDAGAPSVALAGQEAGAGRRRRFPEGPLCPCRPPALQEHFTRSDGMTDLVTTVTGAGKLSGGVFLVCLFSP